MMMASSYCGDVFQWQINGTKYKEILDKNLIQSAQDLRLGQRFTFQQNNDPKHTAKTTQEWLQDKSLNVLEWPSQSPDLNLIEHLWRDLKISVQQRSLSKLTELERICREEWEKFPQIKSIKCIYKALFISAGVKVLYRNSA